MTTKDVVCIKARQTGQTGCRDAYIEAAARKRARERDKVVQDALAKAAAVVTEAGGDVVIIRRQQPGGNIIITGYDHRCSVPLCTWHQENCVRSWRSGVLHATSANAARQAMQWAEDLAGLQLGTLDNEFIKIGKEKDELCQKCNGGTEA